MPHHPVRLQPYPEDPVREKTEEEPPRRQKLRRTGARVSRQFATLFRRAISAPKERTPSSTPRLKKTKSLGSKR